MSSGAWIESEEFEVFLGCYTQICNAEFAYMEMLRCRE